jgi:hypothetical protein
VEDRWESRESLRGGRFTTLSGLGALAGRACGGGGRVGGVTRVLAFLEPKDKALERREAFDSRGGVEGGLGEPERCDDTKVCKR